MLYVVCDVCVHGVVMWWAVSLGGKYVFSTVMCLVLISCSSMLFVLMAFGMFMVVKVMSSLISVMSPPPCLCSLSVRMVV